jgi:hypothetical protein
MNLMSVLAFEFPPINVLLRWQDVAPTINKVVLIGIAAALIGMGIFLAAARKDPKAAPKGARNLASCKQWDPLALHGPRFCSRSSFSST